jgi:uncharacterized membrane protein YfhO
MISQHTNALRDISRVNSLLLFALVLALLECMVYRDFIFGKYLFISRDLGDDAYIQVYPNAVARVRSLANGSMPGWSFHNGLGENMYPFWFEPVSTGILFAFFKNDVAGGMIWVQLTQTFLAGMLFYGFLRSSTHYLPAMAGGLLYAFSSYLVAYGSWFLVEFSATAVQFAFLLLALAQFEYNRRWYFYPLAIGLIGITQPVNVYFAGLTTLVYLLLHRQGAFRQWLKQAGTLAIAGALGLGISCVLLLSNINHMQGSARADATYATRDAFFQTPGFHLADASELRSSFLRLFSSNLQGPPDHFTGWYNYFESPVWYCGLIGLLLVPQYFHFLPRKERIVPVALLGAVSLIALVPYCRHALWLFMGNYYRVISLLFVLLFLGGSMKALDFICKGSPVHNKTLAVSLGLIVALLFSQKGYISLNAAPGLFMIFLFLAAYAGFIYWWNINRNKQYWPVALLGGICLELMVFTAPTLGERKMCTPADIYGQTGYNDGTIDALARIRQSDKGFFRVNKDYPSGISSHFSYNDAKIQDYFTSFAHASFNNTHYLHFLNSIGEMRDRKGVFTAWIPGLNDTPYAMKLCGIKYFLSKGGDSTAWKRRDLTYLTTVKGIDVLKVNNSLPFGITFDRYISNQNYEKLSQTGKQNCLLQAVPVDDHFLKACIHMQAIEAIDTGTVVAPEVLSQWTNRLKEDTLQIQSFRDNSITGTIRVDKPKVLFFAMPYHKGWQGRANDQPIALYPVFNGLTGAFLSPGQYDITLKFSDPYKAVGAGISLCSLLMLGIGIGLQYRKRANHPQEISIH